MNWTLKFLIAALLTLALMPVSGQDPALVPEVQEEAEPDYNSTEFGTAVALSHSISTTTGIAMSPLLGMGLLGAWQYLRSDDEIRADLPWYTLPWVWGICFGIFVLLKSKDFVGAWIPEIVKKPITIVDDIQEKASAAIVALAVIPTAVLNEMKELTPESAVPGNAPLAVAPLVLPIVLIAVCIAAFAVVWLAFHAFSSIKVFSPSSMVNTGISVIKGGIVAIYAFFLALNPWIALGAALLVILFCALIFGWAFRWNVFGALFVKDFVTGSFDRDLADGEKIYGFSTGNFPDVKPRTYGAIERKGDELIFSWKPWLIGLPRRKRIKLDNCETSVRKGIFQPSVTISNAETASHRSIVDLRLRYRTHDDNIRERLALDSISPNIVFSGVKASWIWMRDQVRRSGTALSQSLETA